MKSLLFHTVSDFWPHSLRGKITPTFLWLITFQNCSWLRQNFQKQGLKQIRAQKILVWRPRCKAVQHYYKKNTRHPQNIRISLPALNRPHKTIHFTISQRSVCVFWSLPGRALRKSCHVPPDKSASSGASHAQRKKKTIPSDKCEEAKHIIPTNMKTAGAAKSHSWQEQKCVNSLDYKVHQWATANPAYNYIYEFHQNSACFFLTVGFSEDFSGRIRSNLWRCCQSAEWTYLT